MPNKMEILSFDAVKTKCGRGIVGYSARTKVTMRPDLTNHLRVPVINYYNEECFGQWRQSAHNYQREYVNEHAASENKAVANAMREVMECFHVKYPKLEKDKIYYNVTTRYNERHRLISSDIFYFNVFACVC